MTDPIEDLLARQQEAAEATWVREFLEGPQRTRWSSTPVQVGDAAPDVELPDTSGTRRRLSSWWNDGPVHLVFMRHYGCGCLANRWEELEPALEQIQQAGGTTIAIGQAEPERSAAVASRRGYHFPVLSDPDREAYLAYGLLDGVVPSLFHDEPWHPGDQAAADRMTASRRGTERALVDHAWQLPGEFIIAQGGRITLVHRAQYCEDFPPTGVLVGAITAAASSSDRASYRSCLTDLPHDERAIISESEKYNATLVRREDDTDDLAKFWVRLDGEATPFEPGQYMTIGVFADDKLFQRPYSVASAPARPATKATSSMSAWCRCCASRRSCGGCRVGHGMRMIGPKGSFMLEPDDDRDPPVRLDRHRHRAVHLDDPPADG